MMEFLICEKCQYTIPYRPQVACPVDASILRRVVVPEVSNG